MYVIDNLLTSVDIRANSVAIKLECWSLTSSIFVFVFVFVFVFAKIVFVRCSEVFSLTNWWPSGSILPPFVIFTETAAEIWLALLFPNY